MKAIVYTQTGPAEVLELVEREPPSAPGAGEALVRVVVSGVNPTDWKSRAAAPGRALERPQVPNQDGAGVVEAVGDGVDELAPGQRVWLWDAAWRRTDGTAQELVALPARQVVPLPDDATFELGASLGIPALTAHRALTCFEGAPERLAPGALAGRTVLVAGGAGAVGHAAIQLARWAGATVIATVSSDEKGALARAAGADHVVDYRAEDLVARVRELAPDGVDPIVEVNPNANAAADVRVVAPGGTIAIYADAGEDDVPIPVRPSMARNVRWQFLLTYTTTERQKDDAVAAVAAAVADGALPVGEAAGLPLTRFPLERTADAHRAVEEGAVGKVLIDVAEG
ncbi:NADPH:quinone reductase [Conexibacter arvalis]|uniref:NADPH2:quinone reductase n=1 Tax=Conexibacter arvalis TaxID=912552 RepID=A0A840I8Q7_9ACTN|nr:NADPH:quinone reductase [Conexibacter arvalis]MBB4660705.1 NADPH2:quinone reductase [Conexibacter arvalis]